MGISKSRAAIVAALVGAVAGRASFAALPVDLDDERDPRAIVQLRHVAGFGPRLMECLIAEDESLRCRVDEVPKRVDCSRADETAARPLAVKIEARAFVCAALPAEGRLSHQWRVLVVGESGTVAEWVVEGRTAAQSREAHRREMSLAPVSAPAIDSLRVGVGGSFDLVDGAGRLAYGFSGDAVRGPFRAYAGALSAPEAPATPAAWLPWVGLGYRVLASDSHGLEVALAYRRFRREGAALSGPEFSLGWRYEGAPYGASLHLLGRYPSEVTLARAYGAEAGVQFRVWNPLWLRLEASAWSEKWTSAKFPSRDALTMGGAGYLSFEKRY